jgi:hypothetical protein
VFALEKFLVPLLFPLSLVLIGLGVGLGLLWFSRWQRAGKAVVTVSAAVLVVASHGWTANALLAPLEQGQVTFAPRGEVPPDAHNIRWVVVLGGGVGGDEHLPPTECLSDASLRRLVEGIRLHRLLPAARW